MFSVQAALKSSLETFDFDKAAALVRFMCDLVNANVLLPDCVVALLDAFVSVIHEEGVPQTRKDAYVFLVLSSLPWIGLEFASHNAGSLQRMLDMIERYVGFAL